MKQLFTAEIIERLVHEDGQTVLVLGRDDIITPLARDRARELGLELIGADGEDGRLPPWSAAAQATARPAHQATPASTPDGGDLEARVRQAVIRVLTQIAGQPPRGVGQTRSAWDQPARFPVDRRGPQPVCTTCGQPVQHKPDHLTQLDATHFAPKNIPRIRFRGKMDSVQGLMQLVAARARAWNLGELAHHLDTLAAYCREIVSAEYSDREVPPLVVAGLDEAALREATHHPQQALGIPHLTPGPGDHEILHWLNYLRAVVREAELDALDAFAPSPLHHPTRPDIIRALNRLSSAVYYLALLFQAGKLGWRIP